MERLREANQIIDRIGMIKELQRDLDYQKNAVVGMIQKIRNKEAA